MQNTNGGSSHQNFSLPMQMRQQQQVLGSTQNLQNLRPGTGNYKTPTKSSSSKQSQITSRENTIQGKQNGGQLVNQKSMQNFHQQNQPVAFKESSNRQHAQTSHQSSGYIGTSQKSTIDQHQNSGFNGNYQQQHHQDFDGGATSININNGSGTGINDIPESPCQLQVIPQENYASNSKSSTQTLPTSQTQSNYQSNTTLSSTNRSASQGALLKANSKTARTGKSKPRTTTHKDQSHTPHRNQQFQPQQISLEQYEERLNHDHLKSAITALNEKLKFYENVDQERALVQDQLEQSDQAREELRNNIKETAERIKEEKDKNVKYQEILINENQSLSKQILIITEMFSKKVEEFDELKQQLAVKEQEFNDAALQRDNLQDFKVKYERTEREREEMQRKYQVMNDLCESQGREYKERVDQIIAEKQMVVQDNKELRRLLNDANEQIADLKDRVDSLTSELDSRDAQLEFEKTKVINLENVRDINARLESELVKMKQEREQLSQKVDQIVKSNEDISFRMQEEYSRIALERNTLNQELNELFQEKAEKDIVIKNLTNENLELNSRMNALEQLLCAREDLDAKIDSVQEAYQKLAQVKEKYKNDLEVCTNYLLEVEEKCQEAQKTSLELLQQLKEREQEIESLHEIINQLQTNSQFTGVPPNVFVYHPVKDDPVDRRLADYINSAPIKLRDYMKFERESEGIYKYGKKRVFMKIEKDQIIIRVGGGYLTIEEFIEQYCDTDASKKKLFGLIYSGQCSGNKDFKTFYFTQKTVKDGANASQNNNIQRVNTTTTQPDCDHNDYDRELHNDIVEDLQAHHINSDLVQ